MSNHGFANLATLDKDRKYGRKMVDIQVKVEGGVPLPAHKSVLRSLSGYFREKLDKSPNMKKNDIIIVKDTYGVVRITEDVLILVLDFMYTERLDGFNVEGAKEIISAAELLKIDKLKEKACEYLISILSPCNWAGIYNIAYLYEERNLSDECLKMFRMSKDEINFTRMNQEQFTSVLEHEKEKMKDEEKYELILHWIKCKTSKQDRTVCFKEFLGFINFSLMDDTYLENNVLDEQIVKNDPEASSNLAKALFYKRKQPHSSGSSQTTQQRDNPEAEKPTYSGAREKSFTVPTAGLKLHY